MWTLLSFGSCAHDTHAEVIQGFDGFADVVLLTFERVTQLTSVFRPQGEGTAIRSDAALSPGSVSLPHAPLRRFRQSPEPVHGVSLRPAISATMWAEDAERMARPSR